MALISMKLRVKEGPCQVSSTGRSEEKDTTAGLPMEDGQTASFAVFPRFFWVELGGPARRMGSSSVGRLMGSLVHHATSGQRAHRLAARTAIFRCPLPTEGGSRHYPSYEVWMHIESIVMWYGTVLGGHVRPITAEPQLRTSQQEVSSVGTKVRGRAVGWKPRPILCTADRIGSRRRTSACTTRESMYYRHYPEYTNTKSESGPMGGAHRGRGQQNWSKSIHPVVRIE